MAKTSSTWTKYLSCFRNQLYSLGLRKTGVPVAFVFFIAFTAYFVLDLHLFLLLNGIPPGSTLPVSFNSSQDPCYFSPFCTLSTKTLFYGPADFYFHKPTAIFINRAFHLDSVFSANFVSATHIITSLISAKFIAHESLTMRRVGVALFELRNMLDSLDGTIAKARSKKKSNAQNMSYQAYLSMNEGITGPSQLESASSPSGDGVITHVTFGYLLDGVCDGIGCIFLMTACLINLQRTSSSRKSNSVPYVPLTTISIDPCGCGSSCMKCCGESARRKAKEEDEELSEDDDVCFYHSETYLSGSFGGKLLSWTKMIANYIGKSLLKTLRAIIAGLMGGPGFAAFLVLLQLLLSSLLWNRNIIVFSDMFEQPGNPMRAQHTRAVHSPIMWLIFVAWRLLNPTTLTELILLAVFIDRIAELLKIMKYSGFLLISVVAAISEVYQSELMRAAAVVEAGH